MQTVQHLTTILSLRGYGSSSGKLNLKTGNRTSSHHPPAPTGTDASISLAASFSESVEINFQPIKELLLTDLITECREFAPILAHTATVAAFRGTWNP